MDITLFPGEAAGPLLVLRAPLSFWGGVDPATGCIIAVRHPQCGQSIAGTLLVVPDPIGSSSSSSVLLELIRLSLAPAGIVLGRPDAILVVGCIVAREMGYAPPPVLLLAGASGIAGQQGRIAGGRLICSSPLLAKGDL